MEITMTFKAESTDDLLSAIQSWSQNFAGGSSPKPVAAKKSTSSNGTAKPAPAVEEVEAGFSDDAVTIEQVRAAVKKQSDAGKREKIKDLLTEFHVDRVTNLDQEQYPFFLKKVEALK